MSDPALLGNAYHFTLNIKNVQTGALQTPATITLTIHKPNGTNVTKTLSDFTVTSVGVLDLDYLPDATGRWWWDFVSTGPNNAGEGFFDVTAVGGPQPYIAPQDLRDALAGTENLPGTAATLGDDDLRDAIRRAQAEVDARLQTRGYAAPFTDPPDLVIDITTDIAAYLATLTYRRGEPINRDEPIALAYTRAETLLGQISSGAATLSAPTGEKEAAGDAGAVQNPISGDLWSAGDFALTTRPAGFGPWPGSGW